MLIMYCALVYQSKQQLITAACVSKPKVPTHCALVYQSKQQLITAASIRFSKPKVPTHCVRLFTIGKVRGRSEMKGDANTFFGDCHGEDLFLAFQKLHFRAFSTFSKFCLQLLYLN
ncbi:hypothetical protein RRG08_051464 [Elysia crispata]|uniref:Uncharacterized protein n=1 Tax=Elysia crispata TaxID=231223 RepID=A0AAE1D700_9GAST|nr:hypothetical protein RRG08_051464 [Elysia crispata]